MVQFARYLTATHLPSEIDKTMKRLLLAPLLIALAGCSNDLSVKTDLGEKYLVKDSAVTVIPFTTEDAIAARRINTPIQKCIDRNKNDYSAYSISSADCQRYWSRTGTIDSSKEKWLKYDDEIQVLKETSLKLFGKELKFRPIFVDLNGKKNAGTYTTIFCLNDPGFDSLSSSDKKAEIKVYNALFRTEILDNEPDKSSSLAIEVLKVKMCDKYAKF